MGKRVLSVVAAALVAITGLVSAARAELAPAPLRQAIIGFQPGALPGVGVGGLLNGLPVLRRSTTGSFLTVAVPDLAMVRDTLAGVPGVAYVEDNAVAHALATPNDAKYPQQYAPALMGLPAAWGAVGYGNSNITVAVIDSGVLKAHEDLTGPRLLTGYDYVDNDATPQDTCGHGTHTTGTVGATANNSVGVAGVAQAKLLPLKALADSFLNGCTGTHDAIAQAIMDAADQGANVISMSVGGPDSATLKNAVDYAYGKGVIIVAAAGNDGADDGVDYPGAYDDVVSVSALTSTKARASYSDGGPELDIAAPGSSVLSTYTGTNTTYASMSGTSMATPHVAGALALALGCAPAGTTRDEVITALYNTADDLGAAGRDNAFGYGLARADKLVQAICDVPVPNQNPTAAFTVAASGNLGVAVNAGASRDPNGDALAYAWDFGDGSTGAGVTANHTYASAGTYTITLTVDDGHGGTATAQKPFTATASSSDPDPSTRTVINGQTVTYTLSTDAKNRFVKIAVPAGATQVKAVAQTVGCSGGSCPVNVDLYTRAGARPTNTVFDCRSHTAGSQETCTTAPPAGYTYVRLKWITGNGKIRLTVTFS